MWGQTFRTLTPTLLTLTRVPAGVSKPLLITTQLGGRLAHACLTNLLS